MIRIFLAGTAALAMFGAMNVPVHAQDCENSATIGSGGSAAAGGTSASTLGTGAACDTGDGTTASIGSGGSAATTDGKAMSRTKTNVNPNQLKSQSKAQAMDKGTFSKSMTKTRIKDGQLQSRTKTMSHVPGQKPVKDNILVESELPGQ
jgi:hypothetical protein